MKDKLWIAVITCLAYCIDKELWKAIEYLKEQVRVLKELQEKDNHILLDNHQRIRVAAKARELSRRLLEETSILFTPDTILGWYRRLIAQKYDGSQSRSEPGRPRISQEITDLVIQFKQENPRWGYTRIRDYIVYLGYKIGETTVKNILIENGYDPEPELIQKTTWKEFIRSHWNVLAGCDFFSIELLVRGKRVRCYVLFAIKLSTRQVEMLGIRPQPDGKWMAQVARNMANEEGLLAGHRFLIHDRDPLFTEKFDAILKTMGVEPVKLPPKSPNLNAFAERFVRSIKEECLDHLILSSVGQVDYAVREYLEYYHHERIHQGLGRVIEPRHGGKTGEIICIERLGGLLKSYHRAAA
jgi:putative transposase